ncbi:MAG: hypothetical protein U0235_13945 [Polyangiaceae bacterium]
MKIENEMSGARVGRRLFAAGALAALLMPLVSHEREARADGTPRADVLVIHAATVPGAGSMDPKLANLRQLKNVPFNNYNSFKVLDSKQGLALAKVGPTVGLPNGYIFSLSLSSVEGSTLHIVPSLSKTATPRPLPEVSAKAGEPFFVAGQSYQGGILIIAVTATP